MQKEGHLLWTWVGGLSNLSMLEVGAKKNEANERSNAAKWMLVLVMCK